MIFVHLILLDIGYFVERNSGLDMYFDPLKQQLRNLVESNGPKGKGEITFGGGHPH